MTGNVNIYNCSEITENRVKKNQESKKKNSDTFSNKLMKNLPKNKKEREHKNSNTLSCLCNKSKIDATCKESSSNLECFCEDRSCNDLRLKP